MSAMKMKEVTMSMRDVEMNLNGKKIVNQCGFCWNEKSGCDCGEYDINDGFLTAPVMDAAYA